jgi:hypothetical protein
MQNGGHYIAHKITGPIAILTQMHNRKRHALAMGIRRCCPRLEAVRKDTRAQFGSNPEQDGHDTRGDASTRGGKTGRGG